MLNKPIFPHFKKLELEDKSTIQEFTKNFLPYSDYSFMSLWTYNTKDDFTFSFLNNNLVVRFRDYFTEDIFYSFLGTTDCKKTVETLLDFSLKNKVEQKLKLIPEESIQKASEVIDYFTVEEDVDNFDYIYSIPELAQLDGVRYYSKKKQVNIFLRENSDSEILNLDLNDLTIKSQIVETFNRWVQQKGKSIDEISHELQAIRRLLNNSASFSTVSIGIYDKGTMIGFAITKGLLKPYAEFHFVKADTRYNGVFAVLYNAIAKRLNKEGYLYLNNEQDCGILGLREAKKQWKPISFLKKYTILPKK